MANKNYNKNKKVNETKTANAFVRIMKAIFVNDIVTKLISVVVGLAFWFLTVSAGLTGTADPNLSFVDQLYANIVANFDTPAEIIGSVFDMVLFVGLIYAVIYFLRKNNAGPIIKFAIVFIFFAIILSSNLVSFPILKRLLSNSMVIVIVALLVMFPQELRRGVWKLASKSVAETFNVEYDCTEEELHKAAESIVKAVLNMSKNNVGALIIIATQSMPSHILESGTILNSQLSQPLIECLFNTNANLHDGAVFIHGDKIVAAGCFLPLSQNTALPKELGTRHRAALGISEQYDVLTIVCSEETGVISVARDGKLDRYYDSVMLTDIIEQTYGLKANTVSKKRRTKKFL